MHASNYTWKGLGRSTTASQSGKIKIDGVELSENFAHNNLHGGRELKLESFPEEGGDRAYLLEEVTQEFSIVPHTAQQGADLL